MEEVAATGKTTQTTTRRSEDGTMKRVPLTSIQLVDNVRQTMEKEGLEELKLSIREHGLLQPVVVRPTKDANAYELVAGARRIKVIKELHEETQEEKYATVLSLVRDVPDELFIAVQLIENTHRADLSPVEVADAIAEAREKTGLDKEAFAAKLGMKPRKVERFLKIYHAPIHIKHYGKRVDIEQKKMGEDGKPVVDPQTQKVVTEKVQRPGLDFSLLLELIELSNKLRAYDQKKLKEDGGHKPVAERVTSRLAEKAALEQWSRMRLVEECDKAYAAASGEKTATPPVARPSKWVATTDRLAVDLRTAMGLSVEERRQVAEAAQAFFKALGFERVEIGGLVG